MILRRTIAACALSALMAVPASAGLINNQLNQKWASFRDLSSAAFSAKFTELSSAGYRLIDVDAYPNGSGLLYSQIWEKNSDTRAWVEHRDLTSTQYATYWSDLRDAGFRPSDFESYLSGSNQRYAAIWVKNTEGLAW